MKQFRGLFIFSIILKIQNGGFIMEKKEWMIYIPEKITLSDLQIDMNELKLINLFDNYSFQKDAGKNEIDHIPEKDFLELANLLAFNSKGLIVYIRRDGSITAKICKTTEENDYCILEVKKDRSASSLSDIMSELLTRSKRERDFDSIAIFKQEKIYEDGTSKITFVL